MKFKPIPGYEDFYEISQNGVVRSFDRWVKSRWDAPFLRKGKIMKQKINQDGYYSLMLCDDKGSRKTKLVHRLVGITYINNPRNLPQVNHKNNIKTDNRKSNLKWGTCLSNSSEAAADGLYNGKRGSSNQIAKLIEPQVIEIRKRYKNGINLQKELAVEFGVCKQVINDIVLRKTWTHI